MDMTKIMVLFKTPVVYGSLLYKEMLLGGWMDGWVDLERFLDSTKLLISHSILNGFGSNFGF